MTVPVHPAVVSGVKPAAAGFAGGTLLRACADHNVEVTVRSQTAHSHVCGCSKCWKPAGALFSQVAVVSKDAVSITANADKLKVDPIAAIQRHADIGCGVPMIARVENKRHRLYCLECIPTRRDCESAAKGFGLTIASNGVHALRRRSLWSCRQWVFNKRTIHGTAGVNTVQVAARNQPKANRAVLLPP